jgi:hypothetical protein
VVRSAGRPFKRSSDDASLSRDANTVMHSTALSIIDDHAIYACRSASKPSTVARDVQGAIQAEAEEAEAFGPLLAASLSRLSSATEGATAGSVELGEAAGDDKGGGGDGGTAPGVTGGGEGGDTSPDVEGRGGGSDFEEAVAAPAPARQPIPSHHSTAIRPSPVSGSIWANKVSGRSTLSGPAAHCAWHQASQART